MRRTGPRPSVTRMALDIRTLTSRDELPDWFRAVSIGFLRGPDAPEEAVAALSHGVELARTQGAYDGDRCVGTFRTTTQQLTVPGGASLPSCAVTNVTVSPTHRRRGLLTRMMGEALTAAKERGDALASLISAEYPIYGRYGFGPAAWTAEWEVEVARTGLDARHSGPDDGGRVDFAEVEDVRRLGPPLCERYRAQPHRQGVIDRPERWWKLQTGQLRFPGDEFTPPYHAAHRDADGEPQGLVAYTVREKWDGKLPQNTAEVQHLTALTPAAERALWLFVLSIDWISRVRSGNRAPDDVLPLLLPDPRAARLDTLADFLWLRPLDVPRMLEARRYPVAGTLVLDLHDDAGLAGGRYRLEAGPDGAACKHEGRRDADLAMDIAELGTLFLGDESAVRLAALGRIEERREGAAELADTLFRTSRRAWCPDIF
jgi:predicted acetyltransferase